MNTYILVLLFRPFDKRHAIVIARKIKKKAVNNDVHRIHREGSKILEK